MIGWRESRPTPPAPWGVAGQELGVDTDRADDLRKHRSPTAPDGYIRRAAWSYGAPQTFIESEFSVNLWSEMPAQGDVELYWTITTRGVTP